MKAVFAAMALAFALALAAVPASAEGISGKCGVRMSYTYYPDSGILVISGIGDTYDYTETAAPWSADSAGIKSILVTEGVTGLGDSAFAGCTSLEKATFPESLTKIGKAAFSDCTGLSTIYFSGSDWQWKKIDISEAGAPLSSADTRFSKDESEPQAAGGIAREDKWSTYIPIGIGAAVIAAAACAVILRRKGGKKKKDGEA